MTNLGTTELGQEPGLLEFLRDPDPAVSALLVAGWTQPEIGDAAALAIAFAACPKSDRDYIASVVTDVVYLLNKADDLDNNVSREALDRYDIPIVQGGGVSLADIAGEARDGARQDARLMARIAVDADRAWPAAGTPYTRGLRELADFMDAHPDLPEPFIADVVVYPQGSDDEELAAVGDAAFILGTDVTGLDTEHRQTERKFGRINYRVLSITEARMEQHRAWSSYSDSVSV